MKNFSRPLMFPLIAVWFGHFFVDFMLGIWSVYKSIAELDLAWCGFIGAVCALAGEGLQMLFGSWSDKGYRMHLLVGGMILAGTSSLMGYFDNYAILFLVLLLSCIGSGAFHPAAASLVNDMSSQNKGTLMTFFQSGGGLGMAVSQILFTYTYFAMEGSTLLLIVPSLCLAAYLLWNHRSFAAYDVVRPAKKWDFAAYGAFFRDPNMSMLYIVQLCNQSILWGMIFILPDFLISRGYDTWVSFGGGHLAMMLGSTLCLVPVGMLADKYSPRHVILITISVSMVAIYSFLLIPFLPLWPLLAILFIIGASLGAVSPINVSFGNRLVPGQPGKVGAFLMGLVWCVSEGIGQWGTGLLTKLFADDAPARALGCLGMLSLFAIIACYRLPQEISEPELELAETD